MRKTIFAVLVVGLFLTVAATSAMGKAPTPETDEKVMSIIIGKDNKLTKGIATAEQEVLDDFVTELQDFKTWIEVTRPFKDFKLTDEEKIQIKDKVDVIVEKMNTILIANDLEPVTSEWLYNEVFELGGRSIIVSVGMGYAFIPFYDYEAFFGVLFRPMWILYPPFLLGGGGYTGNTNIRLIPPRVEYGDRLGRHIVRTTVFSGLYLNIGELGYDRMIGPGFMIVLGRANVVM